MKYLRSLIPAAAALMLAGCMHVPKSVEMEKFVQDFIGTGLALSPVAATETGFHRYQEVVLDDVLDDYSPQGIRAMRIFYNSMHADSTNLDKPDVPAESRADLALIRQYCEDQLLDLDHIQTYRHNPTMYVELVGRGIEAPFQLHYAPESERYGHIIARLGEIPAFLATAKTNLVDSPEVWNKVAQQETEGDINLIDHEVRAQTPAAQRAQYDAAAAKAIPALRDFNGWLKTGLSQHPADWRLGPKLYAEKFRLEMANGQTPEQTLAEAEAALAEIRAHMDTEAIALWPKYFPGKPLPADLNGRVSAVIEKIALDHTTPAKFFDDAKADLAEATAFVRDHRLLPLPKLDNLQVIPTPEFMRGAYGVGGFQPAPALQPELGAYYWITPITPGMKPADVESKLREYNFYHLKLLTIHEAMPGHWVQFQYGNEIQPESRGVLREMLGSTPYEEGWAVYAEQLLVEQGYHDVPEMRLTLEKEMLRVVANTILDVKLQTQGMTEQQALDLMIGQTFQERQEAVAKIQRAELTSCQLPSYFVGVQAWRRVRAETEKREGSAFNLAAFHERALKEGALPMAMLEKRLAQ